MDRISRRELITAASAAGLVGLAGCGAAKPPITVPGCPRGGPWAWLPEERPLVEASRPDFDVVVRKGPLSGVLRRRARAVPAGLDLDKIAARMEKTMLTAVGVGIAGPQVGLSIRCVTVMLDYKTKAPRILFIRNPVIVERSDESMEGYEGCLSVPGVGGLARRSRWIRVEHSAPDGAILTSEAEGYNAVLWQHELDHLDGVIFVDRLQGGLLPMDEVRRLRKEAEEREKAGTAAPPAPAAPSPADAETGRRDDCLEGAGYLLASSDFRAARPA
jgi:peptide deformylase